MLKKLLSTCFIMLLGMTFIKSADAHVTLNPDKGEPNTYEKYEIRVPVEKNDYTTEVDIEVPKGVQLVNVAPVQGFKHEFKKDKNGNITAVKWEATQNGIGPNEFIDFPVVIATTDKEGQFEFKATQKYKNSQDVKWNGKQNSEHPSPIIDVKKGTTASQTDSSNEGTKEANNEKENSGNSTILWIVSILAIILSLIALFKRTINK